MRVTLLPQAEIPAVFLPRRAMIQINLLSSLSDEAVGFSSPTFKKRQNVNT